MKHPLATLRFGMSVRGARSRRDWPTLFAIALSIHVASCGGQVWGQTAAVAEDPTAEAAPATPEDQATLSDVMRQMQSDGLRKQTSQAYHWGIVPQKFSTWLSHSNRLIPMYTFGITLDSLRQEGSAYADADRLTALYGEVPAQTLNPNANYFDQTDVYRLQWQAHREGKKNIILIVFDGMDWQTTRAAAIYQTGRVAYDRGRGTGLSFLDYRGVATDFGFFVTSPLIENVRFDVDTQRVMSEPKPAEGGYNALRGGNDPWHERSLSGYLIGQDREVPHTVTDSASSATSMMSGIKTYNNAIGVDAAGNEAPSIARRLQSDHGYAIGIVSSVPVSHATPAAAYANNLTRKDYQDLSRDLIGLPSAYHRDVPLSGVDVLIGGGYGEGGDRDKAQGANALPGNQYLHDDDLKAVDVQHGGKYVVARPVAGVAGGEVLDQAATRAITENSRLLGFFGVKGGHLPFRTANGDYQPTFDMAGTERYTPAEILQNPTLAQCTKAALKVLESRGTNGFWLLVEAGDVDWANHANNLDSSIGAVISGADAFTAVTDWIEERNAWDDTAVIVTSDHGHFLVMDDAEAIARAGRQDRKAEPSGD